MVQISEIFADKREARQRLIEAAERTRSFRGPVDWGPYHPFLQNSFLDAAEQGTWETFLVHDLITFLKQVGLRLGRGALQKIYETGLSDVADRYTQLKVEQNSVKGMIMLVKHAMMLADADRSAAMDLPGSRFAGRYETAADLIEKWCRKELSVQEMMQGMALDVVYTDTFPYKYLHAWEKVHIAMRNLPGVSVSAPGRMSLTRLVFGWLKASRNFTRDHELELMNQIDIYAEVEARFGTSDEKIADLYEIRDQYHRKRVLESRLATAVKEPEIIELVPSLAILGGALPRTHLLGSMDREILHAQVQRDAELQIEFAEDPESFGDDVRWHS